LLARTPRSKSSLAWAIAYQLSKLCSMLEAYPVVDFALKDSRVTDDSSLMLSTGSVR
jgi:hypothetical protein